MATHLLIQIADIENLTTKLEGNESFQLLNDLFEKGKIVSLSEDDINSKSEQAYPFGSSNSNDVMTSRYGYRQALKDLLK